ncbi:hypothetical protein OU789_10950 [Halocynthiibacter sp. C4]|uniref:hypothetical protein n=1 Tax=Halocynthiibacter sp. C4 TaxID=2992758 RepID=UPI00237BE2D3|nr:hypothetical protein [Halocynthiibacter sp. C4]MDE0590445.1 hypothetical protein [Halocynthiibacter sp. C4]
MNVLKNQSANGQAEVVHHVEGDDLASYPVREYSNRQIAEAGKMLREPLPYTEEAVEVFRVAHNWRNSHAYPMYIEKARLTRLSNGALTAGRIKRMASIRKKLARTSISLKQIQDLAGIRAIVDDIDAVRAIEARYTEGNRRDTIKKINDYIASPKRGGYRCLHMVCAFEGGGRGEKYHGQKIEIQVRTSLQHVWATAVEAIGSMRGEDLKAGEGSKDWLRLLELMSAQFSEVEGEPVSEFVPQSSSERTEELKALSVKLDAINHLETYRKIVNISEGRKTNSSSYFLVHMNAETGDISVKPQVSFMRGVEGYQRYIDTTESKQSILVSVDSVDALRAAYPNYFLDVARFLKELKIATMGEKRSISMTELDLSFLKDARE